MTKLKMFKTHPEITLPSMQTKESACFDLSMSMLGKSCYRGYTEGNKEFTRDHDKGRIFFMPGDRIMIPTGLIMDIPAGYSVRLHARSGLSLKQGLVLANAEGVIDSDYIEEVFVLMTNTSKINYWIESGDRIAQAELVKNETYTIEEIETQPTQKTDRKGGMGSTGVSKKKLW